MEKISTNPPNQSDKVVQFPKLEGKEIFVWSE
jgi:hypothetical protein